MLRSSLAAAFAAALAAGIRAVRRGAGRRRATARHRPLRDLVQRDGAAPVRSRHALPAFVLVPRVEGDFRGRAQGRSRLRHRLLGHRARACCSIRSASPPAANLAAGPRGHSEGQGDRREDAARTRVHRRARRVLCRLRQDRSPHPRAGLSQGDGGAGATLSAGRRGADLLRPRARRRGLARRQDLRQSAQGGGDPGRHLQAPAATSRRRPLSHSLLRLSADRRQRASTPPRAIPRSRRRRRTPSTCRPTSSPASATGRNRSPPTSPRCARPRPTRSTATSSTARTTWSTPICSSRRTRTRAPSSTRWRRRPAVNPDLPGASFALAASPARYAVERGDWSGAAALEVRPSKFPHVMAITHFARALGAARSGKPDAAIADIAKLAELRDKLREAKDAYWAEQVDIQWQTANAWLLYAQGKYDEALSRHGRRRRRRGQDREGAGDAGADRAGARALWRDAARARHGRRTRSPPSRRRSRRSRTASAPPSAPPRRRSSSAMPPRRGNTMPPPSRSARTPIRSAPRLPRRARSWRRRTDECADCVGMCSDSARSLIREPGAIMRLGVIDRRSLRNDAERIEPRDRPVIDHVIARLHRLGDAGQG